MLNFFFDFSILALIINFNKIKLTNNNYYNIYNNYYNKYYNKHIYNNYIYNNYYNINIII